MLTIHPDIKAHHIEEKRRIAIVTSCRADWGLLRSVASRLQLRNDVELQIVATNMHLNPLYGCTINEIEADGFIVDARVAMDADNSSGLQTAIAASQCLAGMAEAFNRLQPNLIVILGDRYEMLSVATAATIMHIPIAHIAGGEITEGAFDDNIRHAITKLSALHFPSTEPYRQRIIQMGEQPARVFNCGALGVQNIGNLTDEVPLNELEEFCGIKIDRATILVTYHPVTLMPISHAAESCKELLAALSQFPNNNIIITYPNNDPGSEEIINLIEAYGKRNHGRCVVIKSLGRRRYLSILKHIGVVAGNSSSGIVEVPSAGIPTVDIGIRQLGRTASASVIHCADNTCDIVNAISKALKPETIAKAATTPNPYYRKNTAENITRTLATYPLENISQKVFHNI